MGEIRFEYRQKSLNRNSTFAGNLYEWALNTSRMLGCEPGTLHVVRPNSQNKLTDGLVHDVVFVDEEPLHFTVGLPPERDEDEA